MEKIKNNVTELVFIIDRSGSMGGLESDTIGGFNSLIGKQKKEDGECYVTTVLFDDRIETLHDRVKLADVAPMTEDQYFVRGCTALIDSIGTSIEDVPEHTMFVITTDGLENASCKYSSDEVKKMVEKHKECGWEFLFIGANIDSVETAKHFGIDEDRAVDYHADKKGTAVVYEALSDTVCTMRKNRSLSGCWKKKIAEDHASRKSER